MPEELDKIVKRQLRKQPKEFRYALAEALRDDPKAIRDILVEQGYLGTDSVSFESPTQLTESQKKIKACLSSMTKPQTTEEIIDYIHSECPDLAEEYDSIQHRTWLSTKLNELVEVGKLGRYRDGRKIKYTRTPARAVEAWADQNDFFPEDLSTRTAGRIADDTGMPRKYVRNAIEQFREK